MDYPTQHAGLHSTTDTNRVSQLAWMQMPWGKQSWRQVCTAEAVRGTAAHPPYNPAPCMSCPLLLSQQTGIERKLQCTQTCGWLGSSQSFCQKPKPQDHLVPWTHCSTWGKTSQSFAVVGLVEVVTLTGNSSAISGEVQWPWRVGSSTQPRIGVLCWQSQWPGHSCSMALELAPVCSWALLCLRREKWHFGGWELEWKQCLNSWNLLWDYMILSVQSSRVSLLLLCSSEVSTSQILMTFYQNLVAMLSCLPALHHTQQHCSRWSVMATFRPVQTSWSAGIAVLFLSNFQQIF